MKSLFLALLLLLSATSHAQTTKNNNVFSETSSYRNIYTLWLSAAAASMSCTKYDNTYYTINLTLNEDRYTFESGKLLLLKLSNGQVITLRNIKTIGPNDYTYIETEFGHNIYTYPVYAVTEKQIQQIINGKVVKIRIETDNGYLDRTIKRNKFSKVITQSYNSLQEKLEAPIDVTNIYTNF